MVAKKNEIMQRATDVLRLLKREYPVAICELTHESAFQLLAATILSAQCTDVRVNMVTPALFEAYPTPAKLAVADVSHVEQLVRSTGFYQTKAKYLVGMASQVMTRFGGEVPREIEDLVTVVRRQMFCAALCLGCQVCPLILMWVDCRDDLG